VTLPIGVLRSGAIEFPALSEEKIDAIESIESASVTKVTMHFRDRFWPEKNFGFIHSEDEWFPTCWGDERGDMLTVWAGGPRATELNQQKGEFIMHRALETVSKIFGESINRVRGSLRGAYSHNWDADPFSRGAYSFAPVAAAEAPKILAKPESEAVFFAGEATDLNHQTGTVHAAIDSARRAVRQLKRA
jgi:monoamine oxidase